ncbi:MAG: hypothetical protein R3D02_13770 [Hyphomicrobiales bacterium]
MFAMRKFLVTATIAMTLLAAPAAALAECLGAGDARAAVASGQAVPLARVNSAIRAQKLGEVIGAKLCRNGGRLVYEVTVLAADGNARRISVDAATGAIGR